MIKKFGVSCAFPTLMSASLLATPFTATAQEDSLAPYTQASEVPQTALELWKDYDPRAEDLEVKVHHEWKEDGVVSRLISFKVDLVPTATLLCRPTPLWDASWKPWNAIAYPKTPW